MEREGASAGAERKGIGERGRLSDPLWPREQGKRREDVREWKEGISAARRMRGNSGREGKGGEGCGGDTL